MFAVSLQYHALEFFQQAGIYVALVIVCGLVKSHLNTAPLCSRSIQHISYSMNQLYSNLNTANDGACNHEDRQLLKSADVITNA